MAFSWDDVQGHLDLTTVLVSVGVAFLIAAYSPRRMRALALWIAQYAAFVALVFLTVVTGRLGYAVGRAFGHSYAMNELGQFNFAVAGAAIGGILGFAAGALMVAVFFALLDIRERTGT
jgi:hypothetical protein